VETGEPASNRNIPAAVALAILRVGGLYVLQLRDNRPDVASPGFWALFGGSLDGNETPLAAIRREIREELALDVTEWDELWRVRYYVPLRDAEVLHHIFAADVTDVWARHVLYEGQAAGLFPIDDLPQPIEPVVVALLERYHDRVRPSARFGSRG
jgi:8-oxo-dGTP pyrophosphatase MutT (NUDIX family)